MHRSAISSRLAAVTVTAATLLLPSHASAQAREIVSKQISVGASEASLVLEFSRGDRMNASFRDGIVSVDGEPLGSFEAGSALDASWRALLGQAVALENGPLAVAIQEWAPPEELTGSTLEVGQALDRELEEAIEPVADAQTEEEGVSLSLQDGERSALARLLIGSVTRLSVLEEALEGLDESVNLHIEEDFELPSGETVDGNVVVIDGRATIGGEIRGDLVVVDGSVALEEGSRITGEVRTADARILRNLGEVEGGVVDVLATERGESEELRERLRSEIRDEVRRDLRNELRNVTRASDGDGFSLLSPFRSALRGIGGVIETLFTILVLGLLGAVAVSFARDNIEIVADTARKAPGRSAMVGLAGTFLLIPVWILGAVGLVVTIVGIPVAIAWLPLFPAAVLVAGIFGYLSVARNAGEWLADTGYAWTDWIRKSNPVHTIFAGLIGLMVAFLAAHVISILPFFGFLSGLLTFIGVVVTLAAVQVGFGAVLLTRGGRRREHWTLDPEEAWASAMDIDADLDESTTTAGAGSTATDSGEEGSGNHV